MFQHRPTYAIDARAWLGDLVSGTKYMSLCNVLFLVKYKVHVFSVFRFLKAQKYKHMIFMLNLVFEVQKYKVFRQFLGKIKKIWGKIKNRIFDMIFSTEHDVRIKMWWHLAVKIFAAIFSWTQTNLSFDGQKWWSVWKSTNLRKIYASFVPSCTWPQNLRYKVQKTVQVQVQVHAHTSIMYDESSLKCSG